MYEDIDFLLVLVEPSHYGSYEELYIAALYADVEAADALALDFA